MAVVALLALVAGCAPVGVGSAAAGPEPAVSQALPESEAPAASAAGKLPGRTPPAADAAPQEESASPPAPRLDDSALVHWVSPSGNIACIYSGPDAVDGGDLPETIACQIAEHSYPRPDGAAECQGAGTGANAITLDVGSKPAWMCVGEFWGGPGVAVLAYGSKVTNGNTECLSETTGMTCRDLSTGHGFKLSRKKWLMD